MAEDVAPIRTPDPHDEVLVALARLINQASETSTPATTRIVSVIQARNYLESLTRRLVNEARDDGTSWEDIAQLFGTSALNAKARYGDYRQYDD
jgi:hypothetical protein